MSSRRLISVFLCVCIAVAAGDGVRAQTKSGGFSSYLSRLPAPSMGPSDHELVRLLPDAIDTTADIERIERQLREHFDALRGSRVAKSPDRSNVAMNVESGVSSTHPDARSISERIVNTPQSVPTISSDSNLALLRKLQQMQFEFERSIKETLTAYGARVNEADDLERQAQASQPCNGSPECEKRHRRDRDIRLVVAERARINQCATIISSAVTKVGPVMSNVDAAVGDALRRAGADDKTLNQLGSHAVEFITSIAEQLKLNRMYIANCCRLLREANGH